MKFEFDIKGNDPIAACNVAYACMLKSYRYMEAITVARPGWLDSQNRELVEEYLRWYTVCTDEDPEIQAYELAYMSTWIYEFFVLDMHKLADLFIRRYSQFKGFVDNGMTFAEATSKSLEVSASFEPSDELAAAQGYVFESLNTTVIDAAIEYIEKYAYLFTESTEAFMLLIPELFSVFNPQFMALFSDSQKRIVFELNRDEAMNVISYVPEVGEEDDDDDDTIFVLNIPNLIANILTWYPKEGLDMLRIGRPAESLLLLDDDDDTEDDDY
jgi:hypothetical protein